MFKKCPAWNKDDLNFPCLLGHPVVSARNDYDLNKLSPGPFLGIDKTSLFVFQNSVLLLYIHAVDK